MAKRTNTPLWLMLLCLATATLATALVVHMAHIVATCDGQIVRGVISLQCLQAVR